MISASELRIGNYFLNDGNIYQVKCWMDGNYVNYTDNFHTTTFDCEEIEPVPISPEILESCGFRKGVFRILIGSIMLTIRGANNDTEVRLCDSDGNSISKYFKYVHQLQNLYFTITGDELEIKLLMKNSMAEG